MDKGHWNFQSDFNIDDHFGFVYRVTNLYNGMEYIGRKQFVNTNRKKVKNRKNRKVVKKESNWREYTTSSKLINEEIALYGKDKFKFDIIELCDTKGELSFREVEIQWEEKVLTTLLPDGSRKYYNQVINAVRFGFNNKHTKAACDKMSKAMQGNTNAKGRITTPEQKALLSKLATGRKRSPESIAKQIKSATGMKKKPHSEETKRKIGEAVRRAARKRNEGGETK